MGTLPDNGPKNAPAGPPEHTDHLVASKAAIKPLTPSTGREALGRNPGKPCPEGLFGFRRSHAVADTTALVPYHASYCTGFHQEQTRLGVVKRETGAG